MDKGKILEEYRNTVAIDSLKARNLIKKLDYKGDAHLLQCIAQTYLDESRYEMDGTLRVYIDERKWRMAERYAIQAFKINSSCPEVLWVMAKIRQLNNQTDIAIYCFEKIIKLGIKGFKENGCEIDLDLAREYINDSKFMLYSLYHKTNPNLSKKYLSMYKKGLDKGITTIYRPLKNFLLD